ncbi:28911_t:CDS:1 [Dentiscutata erythropus]|uniref:28911_t:CDS:1 n=1 Tax=Dentiscutata erythropus TaxID=1348616 RepID=A0A9N8VFA6_9GLOM|nr:28911_t:CDS:1 [Dentiscutata erythropus]
MFDTQSFSDKSNLIFNDQKIINEFNPISDSQEISNTYESGEILEGNILENNMFIDKVNESDTSEYSDNSELDDAVFPSIVYQDFVNIVIIKQTNLIEILVFKYLK